MVSDVEERVWQLAAEIHGREFEAVLAVLLDGYRREPGQDYPTRVYSACLGQPAYGALGAALAGKPRWDILHYDQGSYIEIRSRLKKHLFRGLQRSLVSSDRAPDSVLEDLLSYDIGV